MKKKEIEELKTKSIDEMHKLLGDSRTRLRELKFAFVAGKIKSPTEMRDVRKTIARLLTFIQQDAQKKTSH